MRRTWAEAARRCRPRFAVDATGSAFVTGTAWSPAFPTTPSAYLAASGIPNFTRNSGGDLLVAAGEQEDLRPFFAPRERWRASWLFGNSNVPKWSPFGTEQSYYQPSAEVSTGRSKFLPQKGQLAS